MSKQTLRFSAWNVNGIRACATKGFWTWLKSNAADFTCLQETKITYPDFLKICLAQNIEVIDPSRISDLPSFSKGKTYALINAAQKAGYSGVAVFTTHRPNAVEYGIGDAATDTEGRVQILHYDDFTLVNAYVPNSGRELEKMDKKLNFGKHFVAKLEAIRKKQKNIFICGDMNVAHQEIDLKNPKSNLKTAGFTIEERTWFTQFLSHKYVDIFRHFNPELKDAYTWWSYRFEARQRNIGWRIDYFLATQEALKHVKAASIEPVQLGSDHCPVHLECEF